MDFIFHSDILYPNKNKILEILMNSISSNRVSNQESLSSKAEKSIFVDENSETAKVVLTHERPWSNCPGGYDQWYGMQPPLGPLCWRIVPVFHKRFVNSCRQYFAKHSEDVLQRLEHESFLADKEYSDSPRNLRATYFEVLDIKNVHGEEQRKYIGVFKYNEVFKRIDCVPILKRFLNQYLKNPADKYRLMADLLMWGYEATLTDLEDPAILIQVGPKKMRILLRQRSHEGMAIWIEALIAEPEFFQKLRNFYKYWVNVTEFLKDFPELRPFAESLVCLVNANPQAISRLF